MLPATHARLDEKVTCEAVSPHLYLLPFVLVQCYPPLQQLYSDFGDMTLLTVGTGILALLTGFLDRLIKETKKIHMDAIPAADSEAIHADMFT